MPHIRRELSTGWTLTVGDEATPQAREHVPSPVPATVPGCVHTDLLDAGLIPDPYLDLNEVAVDWIGRQPWQYETVFSWQPEAGAHEVDLVCGGLDTIATVLVNDVEVGRTRNMHRSYRFPVRHLLKPGENKLTVLFSSAWTYAEAVRDELGNLPNAYPAPFNFIRKMASNFGWDWGPSLVTAGIWRAVALESWSTARLARVRPVVSVEGGHGRVRFLIDVARTGAAAGRQPIRLRATVAGVTHEVEVPREDDQTELDIDVPSVDLWWPHGLGGQPLYPATVELLDADGTVVQTWDKRIGFRSVRLDTTRDEQGTPFTLYVNEVAVAVRGANWIPDDCFPTRVTAERYRARLTQATEANLDLVRVWGGGIYESDDFYDACDELGLMVWQDFLFACAAYPEENPLRDEVEAEARENVARLMPHPSLVLWNGNNENIWGWFDWDWRDQIGDRTWGAGYYLDLLPKAVADVDPSRPYWPGSPYSGSMDLHPNLDEHGLRHIWDVWNQRDYTVYRDYAPRFVAEFGFQGPPTWATLRRAVRDEPLAADSPGMLHHQKATDGNAKMLRGLTPHLPQPRDFDEWHFLTQVNQARAITYAVEHFRSLRPWCMGQVVWQLNDCWPVSSWAAVDGDGRRKPLWYALRRANAPQLLTIQPRGAGLSVIGVNDGTVQWRGPVTIQRMTLDGRILAEHQTRLVVDRLSQATVEIPGNVATPGTADGEILVATTPTTGHQAYWTFVEDKDLRYEPADLSVSTRPAEGGTRVTVTAHTFVRDLCLFADRLEADAVVDDMLVTLLPGTTHTFLVEGAGDLRPAMLDGTVLRSVNDAVVTSAG
ncbi:glycoside hydrolase family 2 protein [Mangrovihabitans endophyticus]|uniref:beta-mannosidase n=1 Tax=Mangrovihabitans endophyticus TaxID=1751298 RepID=A0A8J3FLN1_9ACTN|nr:glycoside hydrolase family 2 protein [Mangrovihabitans endophyticus]GGK78474.1 beta-mannosidase [Mangrovihabitans endophyticus]